MDGTMMEPLKMITKKHNDTRIYSNIRNIHTSRHSLFRRIARWILCVGYGVALSFLRVQPPTIAYAAQDFSFLYTGLVMTEEAEILSGPGNKYYVTQTVPRGTRVDVYQQRTDGWCAIRPLPESFALVASDAVRVDSKDPKKAIVLTEATPSYIGSICSDAKHTIQVKLHQGETVELCDASSGTQTSELWLRITPPAGEFRWIRQEQLRPLPMPPFTALRPNTDQTVTNRSENPAASVAKPANATGVANPANAAGVANLATIEPLAASGDRVAATSRIVSAEHTATSPETAPHGELAVRQDTAVQRDSAVQPTAFTPISSESVGPPATLPSPGAVEASRSGGRSIGRMPAEMPVHGTDPTSSYAMPMDTMSTDATGMVASNGGVSEGFDITGDSASLTPFQNGLLRVSDQMGTAIAGDPTQWNLSTLQGEVANLSQQARSAEEQQQAQMLAQQLVEYQRIQQEIAQSNPGFNRPAGVEQMGNPQFASMGNGVGNPYAYSSGNGFDVNGTNGLGGNAASMYAGYPNTRPNIYNAPSYTQTTIPVEDDDSSFFGQMRRNLRKLQFWRADQPKVQRTFNGNWAMPRSGIGSNGMGNVSSVNMGMANPSNGYANGTYPMVQNRTPYVGSNPYATDTTALPSAVASAQPVSGWRPRNTMANTTNESGQNGMNGSNGVVFGNRSPAVYVPTISPTVSPTNGTNTFGEAVPPPVPTNVQSP